MIEEAAGEVFSHLCHQDPGRAWVLGGVCLPLCARCTGVYVGVALAVFLLPLARFTPTSRLLWLHGAAILQMLFLGFHLVGEQPAWVRTLSGTFFAVGVVYFLWLPLRAVIQPSEAGRPGAYLLSVAALAIAVQALVKVNSAAVGAFLTTLALVGAAALPLLIAASAAAIIRTAALRGKPA